MLSRIQLLRNVGQFDSVDTGATILLDRYVLVYAENGRGKTTLTAILRSLATGDPIPISERRRLAAANPPHVVLQCAGGPPAAVFENGTWSRTFPNLMIFDDRFVNENVHSGLSVEAEHRQKLHELVLGAQGVTLNRRLQDLVARIEQHNIDLRNRADAVAANIRGTLSVDDFCALAAVPNVDNRILLTGRNLAAARDQNLVRTTPGLEALVLPAFDSSSITVILERDLPALDAAAATRVQQHLSRLGRGSEGWVADGMQRIVPAENGNDICPFCAQDLAQSTIINHYRAYFGKEYRRLRQSISDARDAIDRVHGQEVPARFERAVRVAIERRQFWSRFCDVPEIALDTESLAREWQESSDGLVAVLRAKQAAPLERMEIPEGVRAAIERFNTSRELVSALSRRLQEANNAVRTVKEHAAAGDPRTIAEELAALEVIRTRYTADVSALCEAYLTEKSAKAVTEHMRNRAKADLEQYRATAFPEYQAAINAYLGRFNAGYSIGRVTPVDTRGGPTCNYDVVINNTAVPITSAVTAPAEPAFRNTLSSGDRNTLALAFFFSAVDRDPGLADKVVVIDDPITSLDEHRSLTTAQELRHLGPRVSQLIILSHDKSFLCRVWQHIDKAHCTPIKIERVATGSTIAMWDVSSDSVTEHDRNHALLRSYLRDGPRGDSREVAQTLRPVLEGFLRVAYPEYFSPEPGILGRFTRLCRQRCGAADAILDARDTQELEDLVEYAHTFHHETNPAGVPLTVNDGELGGFVVRVLRFATR